jgi:hypothetical protein
MGHEPVRLQSRQDVVSVDAEGDAHEHVLGPFDDAVFVVDR